MILTEQETKHLNKTTTKTLSQSDCNEHNKITVPPQQSNILRIFDCKCEHTHYTNLSVSLSQPVVPTLHVFFTKRNT